MSKIDVIFIIGGPGSGKGTACSRFVSQNESYVHVSTGDLIRQNVESPEIAKLLADGKLIPSYITCSLLLEEFRKHSKNKPGVKILLDGFPRNEENVREWKKTMEKHTELINVILFNCQDEICIARCLERGLTSGRSDDSNIETIKHRTKVYNETTLELVRNFSKLWGDVKYNGCVIKHLDSSTTKDEVFKIFSRIINND